MIRWAVFCTMVCSVALAGDSEKFERQPQSCQALFKWQEKCRLGPVCDVHRIETLRDRCKRDSTAAGPVSRP